MPYVKNKYLFQTVEGIEKLREVIVFLFISFFLCESDKSKSEKKIR